MAKRKKKDGSVTVYRIRFQGTLTGDFEYDDDGGSYEVGQDPYDFPAVYATKSAAEEACKKYNDDYEQMTADVNAWEHEDTPFFRCDSVPDEYEARVRLPWPLLWDKCLDLEIEPPYYKENAETKVKERPEEEPDLDQLAEWWTEHVDNGPRAEELKEALMPYIKLPELYEVFEQTIDAGSRKQLAIAFAADAGVADSKKLSVTLLDAAGNAVETFSGKASEAIAKANEFLVAHGVTQKAHGTIQFGPPVRAGRKQKG